MSDRKERRNPPVVPSVVSYSRGSLHYSCPRSVPLPIRVADGRAPARYAVPVGRGPSLTAAPRNEREMSERSEPSERRERKELE